MDSYRPKSHIAFDIDGIILDTATEIWRAIVGHYKLNLGIETWTEYYLEQQLNIPVEDLRPLYEPVLLQDNIPFINGAVDGLKQFYLLTQEPILFITARRPQFVQAARASIQRELNNIPFRIVSSSESISESGRDKTKILVERGIKFFVDDHPYTWQGYIDAGIMTATLDWPWTKGAAKKIDNKSSFLLFKNWYHMLGVLNLLVRLPR